MNLRAERYAVGSYSYFEKEADQEFDVPADQSEDALWSLLRLDPDHLPVGEVRLIPGTQFLRLRHLSLESRNATTSLKPLTSGPFARMGDTPLLIYTVKYRDIERSLSIAFERDFPYRIVGWQETGHSGFGPGQKVLTTVARRTHSILSDYWNRNGTADAPLRRELGLQEL
jgi:hypothetical protein